MLKEHVCVKEQFCYVAHISIKNYAMLMVDTNGLIERVIKYQHYTFQAPICLYKNKTGNGVM